MQGLSRKFTIHGMTSVEEASSVGQTYRIMMPESNAVVETLIRTNCRAAVDEIATNVDLSGDSNKMKK